MELAFFDPFPGKSSRKVVGPAGWLGSLLLVVHLLEAFSSRRLFHPHGESDTSSVQFLGVEWYSSGYGRFPDGRRSRRCHIPRHLGTRLQSESGRPLPSNGFQGSRTLVNFRVLRRLVMVASRSCRSAMTRYRSMAQQRGKETLLPTDLLRGREFSPHFVW